MSSSDPSLHLVLTTAGSREAAETLARALLERRLVGCVSLFPVHSLYHWKGRLEGAEEVQMLLKTTSEALPALKRALQELHDYEVPEWIHWPVSAEGPYGDWCRGLLRGAGPPARGGRPGSGDRAG